MPEGVAKPVGLPVRDYRIPAGFSIRPLKGQSEVAAYVDLHQTAFGTKNMTLEWRRRTLQQPAYRPDLDIVVEQIGDGEQLVAYAPGILTGRLEFRRQRVTRDAVCDA